MRAAIARLGSRSLARSGRLVCVGAALVISTLADLAAAAPPPDSALRARLDAVIKTLQANDVAAALASLPPLVSDIAARGHQALLAEALIQQASAQFRSARYPDAFASYERALEAARAAGHRAFEARSVWGKAQVRKNQGRYPEALRLNDEARALYVALRETQGEIRTWLLEGALLDLTGEHRNALDSYRRARALMGEGDANLGLVHSEMGISYQRLGELEQARAMFTTALETHRRAGYRYGQANTLAQLCGLRAALGEYDGAVPLCEESLAICREIGERRGEVYTLGLLANIWWQREDAARASALFERQLAAARELDIRQPQVTALEGLGAISLARGEHAVARRRFEQALEIERASAGGDEASLLVALSNVALGEGDPKVAAPLASRALELSRTDEDVETQWQAHLALGRAARSSRDAEGALTHLHAGVELVSSVRGRVLTDTGKVGYLDARQDLFHELTATLVQESRAMEALEAAEAARGRAFSDLLASRSRAADPGDRSLLAHLRESEAQLRAQSGSGSRDPLLVPDLTRTRAASVAKIDAHLAALRATQRELASLVAAEPIEAAEIRSTAARLRATLLEYLVTRDRLFVWVVQPGGAVVARSVALDRARLRDRVRGLHRQLNALDAAALKDPAPVRKSLRELHASLIAPVADRLPRDAEALVLVVPHDALLMVPFAALEDAKGRALLTAHTLASAPSIATLKYTAGKTQPAKGLADARLLALADPMSPPDAAMEALPGARMEVQRIGRQFAPERRLMLEGREASEANAKRLASAQTILHFAVHGLVRDDRPWDSALLLSAGGGEDGWLRVSELFDLKLAADLVVLSGCSTGSGKLSGDGILGLGRAFIYAGTPSVLVSQWDVSDVSTAYLMERFYAELGAGRSKAQALRTAQLATRQRYPHPALWGAFTLVGEPR